jgi:hypothetical protein
MTTPLENPRYVPLHPPVNGGVPDVIARWGMRSQLRWFQRFGRQLTVRSPDVEEYWCTSLEHRGMCCSGCGMEWDADGIDPTDGYACCCKAQEHPTDGSEPAWKVRGWKSMFYE